MRPYPLAACLFLIGWLVLRPRGCTRGLFRSLRSRGSIHCLTCALTQYLLQTFQGRAAQAAAAGKVLVTVQGKALVTGQEKALTTVQFDAYITGVMPSTAGDVIYYYGTHHGFGRACSNSNHRKDTKALVCAAR